MKKCRDQFYFKNTFFEILIIKSLIQEILIIFVVYLNCLTKSVDSVAVLAKLGKETRRKRQS